MTVSLPDTSAAFGADDAYFGTAGQRHSVQRGACLWSLGLRAPDLAFNGRTVSSLYDCEGWTLERVYQLVDLQGIGLVLYVPKTETGALTRGFAARGYDTVVWRQFEGGARAYARCKRFVEETPLPDGLSIRTLDADTPESLVAAAAELSLSCGVLVPGSAGMRGCIEQGGGMVLTDDGGHVLASGAGYGGFPAGPHLNTSFWGLLATREDRRGERLAAHVGARVVLRMWEEFGARSFITGVDADNQVSARLCSSLGVVEGPCVMIACIDPAVFQGTRPTR